MLYFTSHSGSLVGCFLACQHQRQQGIKEFVIQFTAYCFQKYCIILIERSEAQFRARIWKSKGVHTIE
jgi:hypothetical protein